MNLNRSHPEMSNREIADIVGCSRRLARMVRNEYAQPKENIKTLPKILLFDIETSPMEVYVWGLYKQQIPIQNVIKDWSILSWSAKWLFSPDVMSAVVTGEEAKNREDKSIIQKLWGLIDSADMIVAHNGAKFDVRKTNLRFKINNLPPPMPYSIIDTMKHAMRVFGSASYKLDYLNKMFGLELKREAPYAWWVGAVNGDEDCLANLLYYNRFDVLVLEELYLALRPWMKNHPNVGLYIDTDETVCTNCGAEKLDWGGFYYTPVGKYRAFRCLKCGAIGRSRTNDFTKDDRDRLLRSVVT